MLIEHMTKLRHQNEATSPEEKPYRVVEVRFSRMTVEAGFLTALPYHTQQPSTGQGIPSQGCTSQGERKAGAGDLGMLSVPSILLVSSNQMRHQARWRAKD